MEQYVCPEHSVALQFHDDGTCFLCPKGCVFPVVDTIPRFVPGSQYASSFGLQWNTFKKTQLDSFTGTTISKDRLSRILGGLEWLKGKKVLEAGCGAGRFSEVLLEAGAVLQSLDLSSAVEAARENCASHSSHAVCQASIMAMPFCPESYDVVICIGVVQHTPNPEETIRALAHMVKPGGKLFIDHYAPGYAMTCVRTKLRHYLLPKNPEYCMRFCQRLRDRLWSWHVKFYGLSGGRLGRRLYAAFLRLSPLVDYQVPYPQLSAEVLREWALLDMHDLLTDVYKHLRTVEQIQATLVDCGLAVERCNYAGNGVEASAIKPGGAAD